MKFKQKNVYASWRMALFIQSSLLWQVWHLSPFHSIPHVPFHSLHQYPYLTSSVTVVLQFPSFFLVFYLPIAFSIKHFRLNIRFHQAGFHFLIHFNCVLVSPLFSKTVSFLTLTIHLIFCISSRSKFQCSFFTLNLQLINNFLFTNRPLRSA